MGCEELKGDDALYFFHLVWSKLKKK